MSYTVKFMNSQLAQAPNAAKHKRKLEDYLKDTQGIPTKKNPNDRYYEVKDGKVKVIFEYSAGTKTATIRNIVNR